MIVRRVVVRARRSMLMPVAVRVAGIGAMIVPRAIRGWVIVDMIVTAYMQLRAVRHRAAMRVLVGRRRRVGNGRHLRVVRVGAAHIGAAGMTVSWVGGTLGVGHDNLLYGLTV
ncbi:hypothetical protein [Burkholderia sp. FL-7-2-10-S1-D7]|uniref:hypothetical protein n=1 Tax=Burkholderia sp. FL-7-2-10-S1-D7 TaxID=1637866 RepID=UPI00211D1D8D|nr:hypothetical protein [Burkholderia sp. FL-7-2-10-S1-D7]